MFTARWKAEPRSLRKAILVDCIEVTEDGWRSTIPHQLYWDKCKDNGPPWSGDDTHDSWSVIKEYVREGLKIVVI